jgi:hypothetical protein
MRKTMICLVLLLCSLSAFGQKPVLWNIVAFKHLSGTKNTNAVILTTANTTQVYRLSAYISATQGTWTLRFLWNDSNGSAASATVDAVAGTYSSTQQTVVIFSPEVNVPVPLNVEGTGNYNGAFTIERLQ